MDCPYQVSPPKHGHWTLFFFFKLAFFYQSFAIIVKAVAFGEAGFCVSMRAVPSS